MNKSISCGYNHSVALQSDGTLKFWDLIDGINVIQFIKLLQI